MRLTFLSLLLASAIFARGVGLTGTGPLTDTDDLSVKMVQGIGAWLDRETDRAATERNRRWEEAAGGPQWEAFVSERRAQLGRMLGLVDPRTPGRLEEIHDAFAPPASKGERGWIWRRVRWPVFDGVHGEGLLLRPTNKLHAVVIAVPDATQMPEQLLWAQRLADSGVMVIIPTLISRDDQWSGNEAMKRFTNQPHREWIYRQAFGMGRTLPGYEVQKLLAAIDAIEASAGELGIEKEAIAVAGVGEGALLALYCAALEPRVRAALVSGYFGPREQLFQEPIDRNVFGLLREFGDAQLAAMIAPRPLIIEQSLAPAVSGPPAPREGRKGAAPGVIQNPATEAVRSEAALAHKLAALRGSEGAITVLPATDLPPAAPGSEEALARLLSALGRDAQLAPSAAPMAPIPIQEELADARQRRAVWELEGFTQKLVHDAERARVAAVWSRVKPGAGWEAAQQQLRERLWNEVIGRIPSDQLLPPNPRTRVVREHAKWMAHEVKLDVLPDVFAWGWLLLPRDLQPGERRPVVVCQHGLEGVPEDVVNDDPNSRAFGSYKAFAARLAERGFIVFAPHNPYRGRDQFRMLQRRANPLGLSLFSFIIAQHDAATGWLAGLPFVDPERIAFYGLSYGGKTAMRVPAVLERYCLSICSADYNEWVRKNVLTDAPYSYMFTGEWEMPEWNLAWAGNYAEMAMLIAPRPFMVERGHDDGVAVDEWVAYEYAKVRRGYVKLGIGDRTEIEWFDGPHTINGAGTFEFLHKHLRWPAQP